MTVTVAKACLFTPSAFVHVRVKKLSVFNVSLTTVPFVDRDPLHAPDATQLTASEDDQVSVVEFPAITESGFAVMLTVGIGAGGGVVTVTVVDA